MVESLRQAGGTPVNGLEPGSRTDHKIVRAGELLVSAGHGVGRHQAHLFCHPQRENHPVGKLNGRKVIHELTTAQAGLRAYCANRKKVLPVPPGHVT